MPGPIPATDLHSLPKVELHVHLEGTLAAARALELARRHGADPRALGLVDPYPSPLAGFAHFAAAPEVEVHLIADARSAMSARTPALPASRATSSPSCDAARRAPPARAATKERLVALIDDRDVRPA